MDFYHITDRRKPFQPLRGSWQHWQHGLLRQSDSGACAMTRMAYHQPPRCRRNYGSASGLPIDPVLGHAKSPVPQKHRRSRRGRRGGFLTPRDLQIGKGRWLAIGRPALSCVTIGQKTALPKRPTCVLFSPLCAAPPHSALPVMRVWRAAIKRLFIARPIWSLNPAGAWPAQQAETARQCTPCANCLPPSAPVSGGFSFRQFLLQPATQRRAPSGRCGRGNLLWQRGVLGWRLWRLAA